ncbi:hypothetical protein [Pseudomonas nicosulfuronedens]
MKDYSGFMKRPADLSSLLSIADVEDLDVLVDYITDKGAGRLMLDGDTCKRLTACKERGAYNEFDRLLIAKEICEFGGNTIVNTYRNLRSKIFDGVLDKVLPEANYVLDYEEVVKDVASHMKVNFNKNDDVLVVEDGLLKKILKDSFEKMTPEERKVVLDDLGVADLSLLGPATTAAALVAGKMAGFATFKIALIVANAVARSILGKGLSFAANRLITKSIGMVLGPIGWVVTSLWTIADLASPAYRVTVPCVVQIAYMRQKAILKATTNSCPGCESLSPLGSKFCPSCGMALQ